MDMEAVNVPEELLQHLLGQTNAVTTKRDQITVAVRRRLMAAEAGPAGSVAAAVAVQLSGDAASLEVSSLNTADLMTCSPLRSFWIGR